MLIPGGKTTLCRGSSQCKGPGAGQPGSFMEEQFHVDQSGQGGGVHSGKEEVGRWQGAYQEGPCISLWGLG